jgi:hypothetical protein
MREFLSGKGRTMTAAGKAGPGVGSAIAGPASDQRSGKRCDRVEKQQPRRARDALLAGRRPPRLKGGSGVVRDALARAIASAPGGGGVAPPRQVLRISRMRAEGSAGTDASAPAGGCPPVQVSGEMLQIKVRGGPTLYRGNPALPAALTDDLSDAFGRSHGERTCGALKRDGAAIVGPAVAGRRATRR